MESKADNMCTVTNPEALQVISELTLNHVQGPSEDLVPIRGEECDDPGGGARGRGMAMRPHFNPRMCAEK